MECLNTEKLNGLQAKILSSLYNEIVRNDSYTFKVKWTDTFFAAGLLPGSIVNDLSRKIKFLLQFVFPLCSQRSGRNYQQMFFATRKILRHDNSCFNSFTKTYLVSENGPLRNRRFQSKQGCINLMRIKINIGRYQRTG